MYCSHLTNQPSLLAYTFPAQSASNRHQVAADSWSDNEGIWKNNVSITKAVRHLWVASSPLYYFCFCRRKTLLEYSADDLAKQMTILDNELFQKVDVSLQHIV